MLTWSIKGQEKIIQNLMNIQKQIIASANRGLTSASYKLRDGAVDKYLQPKLGKSVEGAIRDKRTWGISKISQLEVKLTSNSSHSQAVELGTLERGIMHASEYTKNKRAFPVGLSQGGPVTMSATIRPQPGKFYLTQSMNDPTVHNQMLDELAKVIRQAIGV